ncbi:single-stranded DNA-binding protein [Marmoricola sp. Leaf446]|uniref:single-stranded DNA-binding protein n=1 Tax=Marmoricola sp. Leaf446 TaxID=1736379 RepID=UPI0006FE5191|nr:single-stranded DNA-binding protein [Marmoricola sp. Leaf446]KQT91966.1 single-stranded DNA-binding protein [Marmoricola sp. Leaf446]
MAGETVITVVGNLVDDPELRFTPSGAAVANFRIASTPRTFDRQTNEWKDGDALFLSCSVWRQAAENVAESLTKGMRVVIQGRLKQRSYEDREGQKRTVVELEVEEVGPSLKYATAKIARVQRSGGGGGYGGGGQGGQGGDDPWASNPGQGGQAAPAGGQSGQGGQGGYGGGQPRGGSGGSGNQGGGSWGGQQGGSGGGQPQNDPWASSGDEPPF